MNESQILVNRVTNSIERIKHKLKSQDTMPLYNDLLIIQLIVPDLGKKILCDLLKEFNKMERKVQMGQFCALSLREVYAVLAGCEGESSILQDFLICSVQ